MAISFSPWRYMVKSIPPSTAIPEYPSPISLCHSRRGPVAGQVVAQAFFSHVKLRCGPPHCGQSDDCARAAVFDVNKRKSTKPRICADERRFAFISVNLRLLTCSIFSWLLEAGWIDLTVDC